MLKRWFVAMVVHRRILLIVTFYLMSLLYFLHCRTHKSKKHTSLVEGLADDMKYQVLLIENEEQYHHYNASLTKQIFQLKEALEERKHLQQANITQQVELEDMVHKSNSELAMFLEKQLHQAEIHIGTTLPNEFALLPFDSFTLQRVYQLNTGLTRHPVQSLHKDITIVLEAALHILNAPKDQDDPQNHMVFSPKDFFEGICRTERNKGSLFGLTFRENNSLDFRRLLFFRPFAPLQKVKEETIDTSSMLVNIIVPVDKRVDTFQQFMDNLRQICTEDEGLHLTVVYFGKEKTDEVREIIDATVRRTRLRFTLIHLNGKFSRGQAINVGVRAWKKGNVLLFFCDVDAIFTAEFLNSCRMNAQPGKRVFYPIAFSQYNPTIIYSNNIPPIEKHLVINKTTGYWRDFGFEMTCQYWSDFINIGGFDLSIKTWGNEDLLLYRKYLHSNLMVVRAPTRGLFQMWHKTVCAKDLSAESFKMCVQSKAMNEASHSQMGILLFHKELDSHVHKHELRNNWEDSVYI